MATYRQHALGTASFLVSTITYTGFPVVVGSTLVLLTTSRVSSEIVSTVTDTFSNPWVKGAGVVVGSFRLELWYAPSGTAGTNEVTITFSAHTSNKRLWVLEFTGMGARTLGPTAVLDNTTAVDPFPCATVAMALSGIGLTVVEMDGTAFVSSINAPWVNIGGGLNSFAAYAIRAPGEVPTTLAPIYDLTATGSGESLTGAIYDAQSGGSQSRASYWQRSGRGRILVPAGSAL
jgi:hypothetical protein